MTAGRALAAVVSLALGACATAQSIPMHGGAPGYVCRNDGLQRFVGQAATQAVGVEMLRTSGAKTIRWVQPGQMITMEFSAERLTIHLDGSGRIQGASCG